MDGRAVAGAGPDIETSVLPFQWLVRKNQSITIPKLVKKRANPRTKRTEQKMARRYWLMANDL
jgi:hypothetical protein